MIAASRGFYALVTTQALSAFNNNLLRSALLTLVAFRPIETAGMSAETIVALSTLFVVAPYAVLSIPAGRLADRWPKTFIIRWVKAGEVTIFALAAIALATMNIPMLLAALLLAGVEAAIFGPAKFGILPEILPEQRLISGNSWVSATGTTAILAGLVTGNLLVLDSTGFPVIMAGIVVVAVGGWLLTFLIPVTAPQAPELSVRPGVFLADFLTCFRRLAAVPAIILPVVGSSWFWFQGALSTTLMPLYVAQAGALPESAVSVLLIASSVGVATGAAAARWLAGRRLPAALPYLVFAITALPGLDLWWSGPVASSAGLMRASLDFFVLAAGCGLYAVPLGTAVQQLTPRMQRARFIGINHTMNGIAMICSGFAVLLLNLPMLSVPELFGWSALISGVVAALTLWATLPALAVRSPAAG